MKVRISISDEFDLDLLDEESQKADIDTQIDYVINQFCEYLDSLVRYDEVRKDIEVEYIEE